MIRAITGLILSLKQFCKIQPSFSENNYCNRKILVHEPSFNSPKFKISSVIGNYFGPKIVGIEPL